MRAVLAQEFQKDKKANGFGLLMLERCGAWLKTCNLGRVCIDCIHPVKLMNHYL